ncbi:hypothetical protein MZO42_13080 [Sphingomonas psychrotolerans]|uniref:Uncharacterized protein n=1 Tax=Sphingomonas psychrotolerans TaxID=1327635 RepID=A0ABU3N780_9SPHN|nr:hypothetical protein [Sphingomonas psychrotolerans]
MDRGGGSLLHQTISAALLDLNGTLGDNHSFHAKVWRKALASPDFDIPAEVIRAHRHGQRRSRPPFRRPAVGSEKNLLTTGYGRLLPRSKTPRFETGRLLHR